MEDSTPPADPGQPRLPGVVARRGPTTWAGLTESFLALHTGETARAYRRGAARWATWCDARAIDPLHAGRADVTEYLAELTATLSPATVRQAAAAIAGVYRVGVADGLLDRDPVAHVRRPRARDESTSMGLDLDGLTRLLTAADAHSPLAAALYRVYAWQGLRASEPLGCDVGQLTYLRGRLVLTGIRAKRGKILSVPLTRSTATALTTYLDGRTTGPLFLRPARTGPRGSLDWTTPATPRARLAYHQVDRLTKTLLTTAGLPAVALHTHDLRHGFVTLAGDVDGVKLEHVQDAAGHADPRTTRSYDRAKARIDRHPGQALEDHATRHRPATLFDP